MAYQPEFVEAILILTHLSLNEFSKYVATYQSTNNLSYLTIKIAVSVESKTKSKVRMQGRYLLDQCATGMRNTL